MLFLFDFFTIFRISVLVINAMAIINEERILKKFNLDKPNLDN